MLLTKHTLTSTLFFTLSCTVVRGAPATFGISELATQRICSQIHCRFGEAVPNSSGSCVCPTLTDATKTKLRNYLDQITYIFLPSKLSDLRARGPGPKTPGLDSDPSHPPSSFLPTPKNSFNLHASQSSQSQPGTISCLRPYFADSVISYCVQFPSIGPGTLIMNASTTVPRGGTKSGPEKQSELIIVPKMTINGAPQIFLDTVHIIAANMLGPKNITYWVQNPDGNVVKLHGDNLVQGIEKMDLNAPLELAILTSGSSAKRSILSSNPKTNWLQVRGLEGISAYTAKMTKEACHAMKCLNNGGKAPSFNPFTLACYCRTEGYWETNTSG